MKAATKTPCPHPAALALVLSAALVGCGGDSSSSSRAATPIDDNNAAQVIHTVLTTAQLFPNLVSLSLNNIQGVEEDGCENDGTINVTGSFDTAPTPGNPISALLSNCQAGSGSPSTFLDGTVTASAETGEDVYLFAYDGFSLRFFAEDESEGQYRAVSIRVAFDGNMPITHDTYSVKQANFRLTIENTMVDGENSQSDTTTIQTSDFDAIQSDEAGLGYLTTLSGNLRILTPVNMSLDITTHEEIDIGSCETGDLTIASTGSEINVSFDSGTAIVTINGGTQDVFESCADFKDWYNEDPIIKLP